MTRDEEIIQKFEDQTGTIMEKAQQILTTALPGGPGAFAYVVMSSLVGKLFGHTKQYVENAVNQPVTLPDFIYRAPLREELQDFFSDERFSSLRAEFPEEYADFSKGDWARMRRYYKPLFYAFVLEDKFVTEMFATEIRTQNYKRIINDFDLFPLYQKSIQSITPSGQNALWKAVKTILGNTVKEVWSKDYAQQVFEQAKANPEIAVLVENVKTKIGEKVNLDQLVELKDTIKYITGRSLPSEESPAPIQAIEYVAAIAPDGRIRQIAIPERVLNELGLTPNSTVRVFILQEEK